ncbi:hypothetical protein FQA39_LY14977 [Lamprigera yunnana]|nr:hypothetical protein FQA39_LY14977 [Lamprigera yunnana]
MIKNTASTTRILKRQISTIPSLLWHVPSSVELDLDYYCNINNKNEISQNITARKGIGNINLVLELKNNLDKTQSNSACFKEIREKLHDELLKIPNKTHPTVFSLDQEPRVIKTIGQKKVFDFNEWEFHNITKRLNLVRTDQLGNVSGNRSYFLLGDMALLEQALVKYTVRNLLKNNFELVSVPDILHRNTIEACGLNTRGDRTQVYTLDSKLHGPDLCLSGTSEMSLASLYTNKVLARKDLPIKLAAVSRCYRAETSSIVEEKGIFRVHQFTKVEMFAISTQDESDYILEEFRQIEEQSFAALGLHFQVLDMPPHELGAPAYRKYDIEVWLPGRKIFGEISSCSNCTDYQSRRLNIKYKDNNHLVHVHTINGTACAIPRMLIALIETYQTKHGFIEIPEVLQKYMYMEEDLYSFGKQLNGFLEKNQYSGAATFILQINQTLTNTEIPPFTLDTYFLNIFNESTGLLNFLKQILYKPEYKKVKINCFELLHTLINNFCKKIEKHFFAIINVCAPVVRSSASALEKEKSLHVLSLIFTKGNLYASGCENVENEVSLLYNNTLYNCLCQRFDKASSVQEQLLITIGLVAKKFPTVVTNPKELSDNLVNHLNKELQSSDRSLSVTRGCISALSNFLENFGFNTKKNKLNLDKVYNSIKILADPKDVNRRVAFRENLSFVSKHIQLFSECIYAEAKWWHATLLTWFKLGSEDKKAANGVLESVIQEMANILSNKNSEYDKELFKYFMNYFNNIILNPVADTSEKQIGIRGLGLFARSFKRHITSKEINLLFITISQILENDYVLNTDIDSYQLEYLPHYVQSLAFIVSNLPELNSNCIISLQLVSTLLIKMFPQLSPVQHHLVIEAFVIMLHQLALCEKNVLEIFLESIIYQGILWTCSHQNALDAEILKDINIEIVTHKNYIYFWRGLLNIKDATKYDKYEINSKSRRIILRKVTNELMKTLFLFTNKLNLNIKLKNENDSATDPELAYEPEQTNDFIIFVNIVDFYQDIFENIDVDMFKSWIITYINQMLQKSIKYPLVSGYYKLLEFCLKICETLQYFNELNLANEDVQMCYNSLMRYIEGILWKMKQYKGDLQIACFHLIMATPVGIIRESLPKIASCFLVLFSIGRSYLELASIGIDVLEKWVKHIPMEEIKLFLIEVLPSLDSYLRTRSLGGQLESNLVSKFRKTKKLVSKRKILIQTEPELLKLQIKIMTFIGQLDNNLCMAFVNARDNEDEMVWSNTSYLKVTFPYNIKLLVYMDKFVPRVIELSLYCSDRKMRVASCELLHSLVLIILGTSHGTQENVLINLNYLLKSVLNPILKLACDTDDVVQQLFSTFAIQLMHYYSHPHQMYSSYSQILIEALIDAITNSTDPNLRDFGGKCIHEFVKWTIKQTDKDDLLKDSSNIKVWIRNIQYFSLHSDPFKRLGAALIFNNIYTLLREEISMFNIFWVELLYAFIMNLSLTQVKNMDENNCVYQVIQALNHLERGFVEKSTTFNKFDNSRRKPPDLEGTQLKDIAQWLLKQTGSDNCNCRERCMTMFCKIAPLVNRCNNSLQKFNEMYVSNVEWIPTTYETELMKNPTIPNITESNAIEGLFKWFQGLQCALDGYIFVINNNLVPKGSVSANSKFYYALNFFLDYVVLNKICDVIKMMPHRNNMLYTKGDEQHFNYLKSKITSTIIKLLISLLQCKTELTYASIGNDFLWKQNMLNLICYHTFDPLTLGFNFGDNNENVLILLETICSHCSDQDLSPLKDCMYEYMRQYSSKCNLGFTSLSFKERQLLKGILLIQETPFSRKLDINSYAKGTINYLREELVEYKDNQLYTKHLHKTATEFCNLKLQIALSNDEELLLAIQCIFEKNLVINQTTNKPGKYGMYFFDYFKDTLLKFITKNFTSFLEQGFIFDSDENVILLVYEVLKYLKQNFKNFEGDMLQNIVEGCVNIWNTSSYFDRSSKNKLLGLEFISKLSYISSKSLHNVLQEQLTITNWVIGLLTYEETDWTDESSLCFKSEVINILPCVLGSCTIKCTELRNAFQNIKEKYYTNIKKSNLLCAVNTFKKLLDAVKYSTSITLLKESIDIYATSSFLNKDIDLDNILKAFNHSVLETYQLDVLKVIYQMSFSLNEYTNSQRYIFASKVLTLLLQTCYYNTFEQFYITNIKKIIETLEAKTGQFSKDNIINKMICCMLIEVLFFKIKIDHFQDDSCNISKTSYPNYPPSDKKLLKSLTQIMIQISKENYNLENQEDCEIFRLYQCHAYNTLISLISNTQTSIEYYNLLFIRENVWTNIIDTSKKYVFEIDFDSIPTIKKVLTNIRSDIHDKRRKIDPTAHSIKYMESQRLFNSSLSEDITKFDFTHAILRSQTEELEKTINKSEASSKLEIALENVTINLHECMAPISATIQHMIDNDINPLPPESNSMSMPKWVKGIMNVLTNEECHDNIKIFLTKLIHNCQHVFKYYAKFLYLPILKMMTDGVIGHEINFFVTDLIVMLTSWSSVALPEDNIFPSKLLEFLMSNCDSDVRSIFKYNLEQIKLIIETWKTCLDIPYDILYSKLLLSMESQKLDVGIHLTSTILANNISPWADGNLKNFLMTLCKILKSNKHRSVYQPCAEVLGMALKFISLDESCQHQMEQFKGFLNKLLEKLSSDDNKFAYCLQGIVLHYPTIAINYLLKLTCKLKMAQGNFKCIYLKILLTQVDALHEINELSSIDFQSLLMEDNVEIQVLTLEIIQKSILHMAPVKLLSILKDVANFVNNAFVICRNVMYDIFITTYNKFCPSNAKLSEEITVFSKNILLKGLVDKEGAVQEKMFQFWMNHDNMPKNITSAFLFLLDTMYTANLEENYICYSTYFLLNILKTTEEYSEKLFDRPLYKCDFEVYKFISNWRRQHASMAPLFASSLSSQDSTMNIMNLNVLRATVSTLEFQPTQISTQNLKPWTAPSSSLLFSLPNEEDTSNVEFKDPNVVLRETNLRSRRFLKDKSKVSRHFAYLQVNKTLKQEELRKERVQKSEKNITLCRNYRIGEYPDVEITLSSIINPLQVLIQCDTILARQLYVALFTSLVTKLQDMKKETLENVQKSIYRILNDSTQFIPNTIGAFLDIALVFKKEIKFDPTIIANVSRESGLLSTGSLLLEEYLLSDLSEASSSKKVRGLESVETCHWVKLAEYALVFCLICILIYFFRLYKEMNEWDVVRGIFMEKMNCSEIVLNAIEAESTEHWRNAQQFYAQVIEQDTSDQRRDFYYDSYFKSFAALAEWDKLTVVIDQNVCVNETDKVWPLLWDNDWNQRKLLPWYLTASLRNTLKGDDQSIFTIINEYLQDPAKSEYLKTNFGEELAMLCLLQNDSDTANYYLNNTLTCWLENWSHINPLFVKLRANTVFNLKSITDIYSFVNFINTLKIDNCKNKIDVTLKLWTETSFDALESLLHSETTTVYRNQFISVVQQKVLSLMPDDEIDDVLNDLNRHKFKLHINLIEHALEQKNYYVARKFVKLTPILKNMGHFENMQWTLALSKILYYLSQTLKKDDEKMAYLLNSWSQLGSIDKSLLSGDNSLCCLIKTKHHTYELTQKVHCLITNNDELYNKNEDKIRSLIENVFLLDTKKIQEYGVTQLQNSLNYCENEVQNMMNTENLKIYSHMASAYISLAYYSRNEGDLNEMLICSVLRAMKMGSSEGRQLFPCLLHKSIAQYKDTFKKECSEIPTWMFLKWIPQLLANLDTICIHAIDTIVLEIAKTYPQAIMFPYKISKEKYKFESPDLECLGKELIKKLNNLLLPGELLDTFLKALGSVTPPVKILLYHIKRLKKCTTKEQLMTTYENLMNEVFSEQKSSKVRGVMFKKLEEYEAKLNGIFKGKVDAKFSKDINQLEMDLVNLRFKRSIKLMDYSPWLANFRACELRENLEIPGQYSGEKRPLIQYHTKIIGFSQSVMLLDSLRAPIQITILGNDAKEYKYIIKFGEDLRQDQRIEQTFTLMNNILTHDSNCNKRQMKIDTYQVIPLTPNLGIIEWLNDTEELQKLISNNLLRKETILQSRNDYTSWIEKKLPKKMKNSTPGEKFGYACSTFTDNDVICKFRALANSIEADILKKSFWNISISPENYFTLRQKFAVSYAVICISHWLLGIGDRHLQNTLISLRSGRAIGIDFGYAFGVGTQILPIPELVPFRLTPHLLNLLEPLNEQGLLQESMIHCLRAFRKNFDILLATISVFIKEPSLDWLEFAQRIEIISKHSVDKAAYSEQKMDHVKRKLQGVNPTSIMVEELSVGHSNVPQFRDAYIKVVKGKSHNFRAKVKDQLSEEDQVKCLLDQATDYNLLGRMFDGWLAWI